MRRGTSWAHSRRQALEAAMTNEPPDGEGEELVEADLPGWNEPAAEASEPPTGPEPDPEIDTMEVVDRALRNTEESPAAEERGRLEALDRRREDHIQRLDSEWTANNPEDSDIEDLDINLPQAMAAFEDAPLVVESGGSEELVDDDPHLERLVDPVEHQRQFGDAEELVEADLPGLRDPEAQPEPPPPTEPTPEPTFDEVVDDRIRQIGENLDADARARSEQSERGEREEFGLSSGSGGTDEQFESARDAVIADWLSRFGWLKALLGSFIVASGIGLLLILTNLLTSGSGEPEEAAVLSGGDTTVATEAPTAAPANTGATEAPTAAAAVAIDPAAQLVIATSEAIVDSNGDLWILLGFDAPWVGESPTIDFAWAALVAAGVEIDGSIHGATWSVTDGQSYAEGLPGGSALPRTAGNESIVPAELWITPDGMLAIRLPGSSPTGGLDATLVAPDSTLIRVSRTWAEVRGDPSGSSESVALGPIAEGGNLPLPTWLAIEPDLGPIILNVPDTSNSN
jgi:hypothetical protein